MFSLIVALLLCPTCTQMHARRAIHSATRLADGRVLIAGGMIHNRAVLATAEVFDPATGTECDVTTEFGTIVSAISSMRPVTRESGKGQSLAFAIGHGAARVIVRTFKGDVHVTAPSG